MGTLTPDPQCRHFVLLNGYQPPSVATFLHEAPFAFQGNAGLEAAEIRMALEVYAPPVPQLLAYFNEHLVGMYR